MEDQTITTKNFFPQSKPATASDSQSSFSTDGGKKMKVKFVGTTAWIWTGCAGTTTYNFQPNKEYEIPEKEYNMLKGEKNWFFIFLSEKKPLAFNPNFAVVEEEEVVVETPEPEPDIVEVEEAPKEEAVKPVVEEKKTTKKSRKR